LRPWAISPWSSLYFPEIFDLLSSGLPSDIEFVGVKYGRSEKIVEAEFVLAGLHRIYGYVYHPAYGDLPQNDADNRYERIDNDWYRHFQDAL
jgi:hypothetical protein